MINPLNYVIKIKAGLPLAALTGVLAAAFAQAGTCAQASPLTCTGQSGCGIGCWYGFDGPITHECSQASDGHCCDCMKSWKNWYCPGGFPNCSFQQAEWTEGPLGSCIPGLWTKLKCDTNSIPD
jgi:hypothetical protein